ncbi:MAG: AraC family transcriptional regulator [Phycisphaerae bacterium]|nr:AraC family transcriptional regulator [Phycisphaerae bacterium]
MKIARAGILGNLLASRRLEDIDVRFVGYRPGQEMRRHAHGWMSVTLVLSGILQETVEGRTVTCRPLSLVVKPEGAEHETRAGPIGAMTLNFRLERQAVRQLVRRGVDIGQCGLLSAGTSTALLLEHLRTQDAAPFQTSDILADAILGCMDASLPAETAGCAEHTVAMSRGSTRAAANSADMHPVSYARRFRRTMGVAPSQWRIRQRVSHAACGLANGHEQVVQIALAAGFSDQAHLCRLYKRETGLTPNRYRQLIRSFLAENRHESPQFHLFNTSPPTSPRLWPE